MTRYRIWIVGLLLLLQFSVANATYGRRENASRDSLSTVIVNVYQKNQEGYACYRIPAVVMTKKGTVLAFAEARKKSYSDTGDIDMVVKRSVDGGKTWGGLIKVWDDGDNTCGNPVPIVDAVSGRVYLLSTWNLGTDKEQDINNGTSKNTRRVFFIYSDDDGLSWSVPEEITSEVKRNDWTWYATGPCHGIQMQGEKYKGRLIVPANHNEIGNKNTYSHVIYSDDRGQTWRIGGIAQKGTNESSVVELSKGDLMLNMRNYNHTDSKTRACAVSHNGGHSWSDLQYPSELIEPVCQGSILNDTKKGKITDCLFFCNPASISRRERMTVRMSKDKGRTWQYSYIVYTGPSAYSDMVLLSKRRLGVLFECGNNHPNEKIVFCVVPINKIKK